MTYTDFRVVQLTRRLAPALIVAALGCREDAQSPTALGPEPASLDIGTAQALAFARVSTGGSHSCGVTTDNRAFCWGANLHGQLGNGTSDGVDHPRPIAVAGGLRFLLVDAGATHTCGVSTDNRAYCWGDNSRGSLGLGSDTGPEICPDVEIPCSTLPVGVAGGRLFRQVSASTWYTCGVNLADRVFCWGTGDGLANYPFLPQRVGDGLRFRQVSAKVHHICGVTTDSRAYCWGDNTAGQLGDGTEVSKPQPVPVVGGLLFRQVSVGGDLTCGVTTNDRTFCWGTNRRGQLGIGTADPEPHPRPVRVAGGIEFRRVEASGQNTCGLTAENLVYCWGDNRVGQFGDGTTTKALLPVPAAGERRFRQLGMSGASACGVNPFDRAFCWGLNGSGQLGDGTTTQRLSPVRVVGPT
jgi:alpha-tubulin suppressor-like RCC1 family protein